MTQEHLLTPEGSFHSKEHPSDVTLKGAIWALVPPTILGYLFFTFERIGLVCNIFFMSKDNNPIIIAAMGFGNSWMIMFALGLSHCFCFGMATLVAQARGAGKHALCGRILHKGALIALIIFLLYLFTLVVFRPALSYLKYDPLLIDSTQSYTLWMLPSQVGSIAFTLLRTFAQGHQVFNMPVYIQVAFTAFEIFTSYIFVYIFDYGFAGLGFSRGFSEVGRTVVLFYYMRRSEDFSLTLTWFDGASLEGLWKQLKFQFYTGMVSYVEYFAFLCGEIVTAYLGVIEFDASFTYITIATFLVNIPCAVQQPAGSFIGNAVGERNLHKTKLYIKAANIFMFSSCVACSLALGALSGPLSGLLLDDPVIKEKTRQLLLMYMCFTVTDMGQMLFPIMLRSLGKEAQSFKIMFLTDFVIGIPLEFIGGIVLNGGALGTWIGLHIGYTLNFTAQLIYLSKTDISKAIIDVHKTLASHEGNDESGKVVEVELKDF